MGGIFELLIYKPLGFVMNLCYRLTSNYGLAVILFALIAKVCLLPFGIKSQKSMARMNAVKPKEEIIRKKYAGNPQKTNEEIAKLYQEEGISPMGGCLPLLLQFPILLGLYRVIYRPLSFMLGYSAEKIQEIVTALGYTLKTGNVTMEEIEIARAMSQGSDKLAALENIQHIDFSFLGVFDLSATPSISHFNWLILIPVTALVTSWLAGWISQRMTQVKTADGQNPAGSMNTMMLVMMPFMSLFFTFQVPAGLGLYWIISNILAAAQSVLLAKLFPPKPLQPVNAAPAMSRNQQKKLEARRRAAARAALEQEALEDQAKAEEQAQTPADRSADTDGNQSGKKKN